MNFVFDLYGTLIDIKTDEEKESLWRELSLLLNGNEGDRYEIKSRYESLCEKKKKDRLQEVELSEVFEALLVSYGREARDAAALARAFRRASMEKLRLFPCVKQTLKGLKVRGASVYLLSNAQACFTRDELEQTGLARYFDGVLLSSEVGWKKPSAQIFSAAFERFGIEAEDSFYVGNDLRDDVFGANAAGMKTVYIFTEQSGRYETNENFPPPDHTVKDHTELKRLLFALAEGAHI